MNPVRITVICFCAVLFSGCATFGTRARAVVTETSLLAKSECNGHFGRRELPHITTAATRPPIFFDCNGAGVALADLDDNGLIDVILGGLQSPVTILWNNGGLQFERTELPLTRTRDVNAVDVDGDGRLDLVFSISGGFPSWWRADGPQRTFVQTTDEELAAWFFLYTMNWSDLDGDGDLDMVGGSYNQEIVHQNEGRVIGGGVFYYENTETGLVFKRLGRGSQALAISFFDLNLDGRRDIVVGNDFSVPDYVYLNTEEGWVVDEPFKTTTQNTMSFAEGDLDNDGYFELFATDMKPFYSGEEVDAAWLPMLHSAWEHYPNDGVQTVANVLQVRENDGTLTDQAEAMGIDSTGWTWSVQFGDLDNDGLLDLYVVNGMIASEVFGHLPGAELVEENLAFRNSTSGGFVHTPEWGLGATESGRGMAMADLDLDGDLDIVVNNLESPAVLFENQICGGASLEVDLRWTGTKNIRAIGATVLLETTTGNYMREVRAKGGYLSGDPSRLHFGFPRESQLISIAITWPDGAASAVHEIEPNTLVTITR